MNRIVFLTTLFLLFWLNPLFVPKAKAQGTFGCFWNDVKICQTDSMSTNCQKNYVPNPNICSAFRIDSQCKNAKTNICIPLRLPASCPTPDYLPYVTAIQTELICCSREFLDLCNPGAKGTPIDMYNWCESGAINGKGLNPCVLKKGPRLVKPNCPKDYEFEEGSKNCILQGTKIYHLCEGIPKDQQNACYDCIGRPGEKDDKNQMWTALGCINITPVGFISWLLSSAIGLGGGIAFLLMIFGAFQVIISGGDPEKLNSGKEIITSAVAGLLMIIFSVVLLKIIGYDILRIPGITLK